jgi:AraC family transcriptional regulator
MAGHRASTQEDHQARIATVVRHLEADLGAPLDLEALARRASYAKHHFHRVFRGIIGESVAAHVRRLRLERAARALGRSNGRRTITDLALDAGYDSPEAFTHAFVRLFGIAPSTFATARPEAPRRVAARGAGATVAAPVDVELRRCAPISVIAERHVGSYQTVGEAFERIVRFGASRGLSGPLFGLCPDDPEVTDEARLRFDACLTIPAERARELQPAVVIPGGRYAVAVHRGPYTTLDQTYLALIGRWLPTTKYELCDEPVVEAYLNDPATADSSSLLTEVRVRLADG